MTIASWPRSPGTRALTRPSPDSGTGAARAGAPPRRGRARRGDPADAREKWITVYDDLSDGHPGLWGAATARAEAHTVRLAMLYALLDCSPAIRVEHLDAALAFWHYASES